MEAFCFCSYAPSGLTKVATTTYAAFGTSLSSVFFKVTPLKRPPSNIAEADLINIHIKEVLNCEQHSSCSSITNSSRHSEQRHTGSAWIDCDSFLGSGSVHRYLAAGSWMWTSPNILQSWNIAVEYHQAAGRQRQIVLTRCKNYFGFRETPNFKVVSGTLT